MFIIIIIIIIIRNGTKTISLQASFGDLIIIRNVAKKISLQTSFGDLIRYRANARYDIIWLPSDGYQFATS
jgi:hypothetical protein